MHERLGRGALGDLLLHVGGQPDQLARRVELGLSGPARRDLAGRGLDRGQRRGRRRGGRRGRRRGRRRAQARPDGLGQHLALAPGQPALHEHGERVSRAWRRGRRRVPAIAHRWPVLLRDDPLVEAKALLDRAPGVVGGRPRHPGGRELIEDLGLDQATAALMQHPQHGGVGTRGEQLRQPGTRSSHPSTLGVTRLRFR